MKQDRDCDGGRVEYEADQRHAEILMRDTGINESSKLVMTPRVSNIEGGLAQEGQARGESLLRTAAATSNYLG